MKRPERKVMNTALMYEGGEPGGAQFPRHEVYRGTAAPGDEERIRAGLVDGEFFIPTASGIPPVREGLGRVRHRFAWIRETEAKATDNRKISQIVDALSRAREDMERLALDTGPKVKAWARRP